MNDHRHQFRRRPIRLPEYDYTQAGAYFITLCTYKRKFLFGNVVDSEMRLNQAGQLVLAEWLALPRHYPHVSLDVFVVMPNHVHGIVILLHPQDVRTTAGAGSISIRMHGLSEIVRALKTFSARRINASRSTSGTPLWQRGYYEHIIRTEESLNRIREYVVNNPIQWEYDRENPFAADPKPNTGAPSKTGPADEPWRV